MGTGDHRRRRATSPPRVPASRRSSASLDKAVKRIVELNAGEPIRARRRLRHERPVLRRRHPPQRRRARDARLRRGRAGRVDGEHRALERRRRDGAGLDLDRGARDLPGGPAAAGREAGLGGRADPLGRRDHEGATAGCPTSCTETCGPGSRRRVSASGGSSSSRAVRARDIRRRASQLHGPRRAGRAPRARGAAPRGVPRSRRSRTAARSTASRSRSPATSSSSTCATTRTRTRAEQRLARRLRSSRRRSCS